ncbi:serine kinase [candidate division KSB1 bacterium]|nr:MAG: serine kinase [candidate division KSB1 bacterium]
MNLKQIIEKLNLKVIAAEDSVDVEVKGGYVSDLLSDVMANARNKSIWITLQMHQNIIAVASLKEIAGIIIVNGRKPDEETIKKAEEQKIPLLLSDLPAFEIAGMLYSMGISG